MENVVHVSSGCDIGNRSGKSIYKTHTQKGNNKKRVLSRSPAPSGTQNIRRRKRMKPYHRRATTNCSK